MSTTSTVGAAAEGVSKRRRVRTPGKHIVLFLLAVTLMIALSALAVRSGVRFAKFQPQSDRAGSLVRSLEFLTDLSPDADGRVSLVKATVRIAAADAEGAAVLDAKAPVIRERIGFFLREMTPEDFAGAEGQARVKAELKRRVDLTIAPAKAEIVLEDLVIQ
jgi:flagellar basal body-associated protein FliL